MRRLALGLGAFFLFLLLAMRLAAWTTEAWWFDEVGYRFVFNKITALRFSLFAIGSVFCFAALWLNWRRIAVAVVEVPRLPEDWASLAEEPGESRGHFPSPRQLQKSAFVVALLLSLGCGLWLSTRWSLFVLFLNSAMLGQADPVFGLDLGFWLLRLPLWQFGHALVSTVLWTALLGAALLYELSSDIAFGERAHRLSPRALRHLTKLGVLLLCWKALGLRLYALGLVVSQHGVVSGAGYTDIHVRLPLITLAFIVTLVAALLLWRAGRALNRPGAAKVVLGYMVISLLIGVVLPGAVQRWRVAPNEPQLEKPYIERMMSASRSAYGLEYGQGMADTPLPISPSFERAAQGLPLWPPDELRRVLNANRPKDNPQAATAAPEPRFGTGPLQLDRYFIDREWRPVFVGVKDGVPAHALGELKSWERRHLDDVYGDGLVAVDANRTTASGAPVNYTDKLGVLKNEVYFGLFPETPPSLRTSPVGVPMPVRPMGGVITEPFVDFVVTAGTGASASPAGINIDSPWRRWLIALRFGDWQLATNERIGPGSRVIWYRRVLDRCRRIAPFLDFPESPYPVAVNGRIVWVLDGFTGSATYPYAQRDSVGQGSRNYYRNPVKATVDAFDGSVKLYLTGIADPVIEVWQRAFPKLFLPIESMPYALHGHLRYPAALLDAQRTIYTDFRNNDAAEYYLNRNRTQSLNASYIVAPRGAEAALLTVAPLATTSSGNDSPDRNFTINACLLADGEALRALRPGAPLLRVWSPPGLEANLGQIDSEIDRLPRISEALSQDRREDRGFMWSPLAVAPSGDRLLLARGLVRDSRFNSIGAPLPRYTVQGAAGDDDAARLDKIAFWSGRAFEGDSLEEVLEQSLHALKKELQGGPKAPTSLNDSKTLELLRAEFRRRRQARQQGDWEAYEKAESAMQRLLNGDIPEPAASLSKPADKGR